MRNSWSRRRATSSGPARCIADDAFKRRERIDVFATLRVELVDDERYTTRDGAEASIGDYIERFYNAERLHSHLGYISPNRVRIEGTRRRNRGIVKLSTATGEDQPAVDD